jgi:mitochondrial fission protein ELM1
VSAAPGPPPRVWAVLCYRAGENAQILALAEALGWPFEVKRLAYRPAGQLIDVWRRNTLLGIDRRRSDPLRPPWPDLLISAAMRNEPVCRWIRDRSGGRTRYVHIGKPWARPETFELVVTVPEYPVPELPNVLRNTFSLNGATPDRLAREALFWRPRLAHLPRPWIAVLVGGYSGPYPFDPEKAARLGREASALAAADAGSLLVTTSSRTSKAAADALERAISVPCEFFRWKRDAPLNPFFGFLALADAIVVTSDSATMLAEACATGRPVHMFDMGRDEPPVPGEPPARRLHRAWRRCNADRLRAFLYRHVMWGLAPRRITRDIRVLHRLLLATGRAVWLGEPFRGPVPPPVSEMPGTVARVKALLEEAPRRAAAQHAAGPGVPGWTERHGAC